MKTVAIIGGGFSGTVTAANLARLAQTPVSIKLINHGFPLGRGIAYSTGRPEHLLNVVARNMSALADYPNHFVEWLATRCEFAGVPESVIREQFIPRRIYGDYLQSLLFWHSRPPAGNQDASIETIRGEAIDILPSGPRMIVMVDGGPRIEADKVLLATGNPLPAEISLTGRTFSHPNYFRNPWQNWEAPASKLEGNAVLIGAGLTMIDTFLSLMSIDWKGTILVVSRTGLLPLSHFKGIEYHDFPPADPSTLGLKELVELIEDHCNRLRQRGENPAMVVDKLRPFTQRIWQHLSVEEKQQFCRQYRTRWNVTRHRVAQSIHEELSRAIASGKIQLVKGTVHDLAGEVNKIKVSVKRTGDGAIQILDAGLLINCTGPQESCHESISPLFRNLFARGLVQPDDMNMGVRISADFATIDSSGQSSSMIYAMGPLVKGTLWETTAVPELRIQAYKLAESILAALEEGAPRAPAWSGELYADLIEYCI